MMWRALTGRGFSTLRIEPSGALTSTGASEPALLGISGATAARTPNAV